MMFLDTTKLTFNNASLLWKVLLYHIVCIVLVCGITVAVCYPLIVHLSTEGFFADVFGVAQASMFSFEFNHVLDVACQVFTSFGQIVSADMGTYLPYAIVAVCLMVLLGEFLFGMAELPTKECLYGYMSSWSKLGFAGCFVKNLSKSTRFSLVRLLVAVPFDVILAAMIGGLLYLFSLNTVWSMFVPFFMVLGFLLLATLRTCLLGGWACSVIVKGKGVFAGVRDGVHSYAKAFGKMFGLALSFVLIIIALNVLAVTLTASVGLIVTLPFSLVLMYTYHMVVYFYTNGMRFYVDKNKIVTPVKIEDFESIKVLKNII